MRIGSGPPRRSEPAFWVKNLHVFFPFAQLAPATTFRACPRHVILKPVLWGKNLHLLFRPPPLPRLSEPAFWAKNLHFLFPPKVKIKCRSFAPTKCVEAQDDEVCKSGVFVLIFLRLEVEARVRIELTHKGFADLSLTTWVPRRKKSSG